MPEDKRFVYVLKSADPKPHFYVGRTSDARARLADHNAGHCPHTLRYRPWKLHVTIELPDEQRAVDFERYLKSGPVAPLRSGTSDEGSYRGPD